MKKFILIGLFSLWIPLTFAKSFYCPSNHQYINLGATVIDVIRACGTPSRKKESSSIGTRKEPVSMYFYQVGAGLSGIAPMRVIFAVEKNKIVLIKVAGEQVNSASVCANGTVKMGDAAATMLIACGDPIAINETHIEVPTNQQKQVETWEYHFGPTQPKVIMTFTNGRLTNIQP